MSLVEDGAFWVSCGLSADYVRTEIVRQSARQPRAWSRGRDRCGAGAAAWSTTAQVSQEPGVG